MISLEHKLGLDRIDILSKFNARISVIRDDYEVDLFFEKEGKTIAGFGAPTKATTLMAHFRLDERALDFIVDDNPLKQGLFTPITHIPILSSQVLYERKPDYLLILAWNFSKPIMKMHKNSNEIGKFIIPMPEPKVIS